MLGDLTIKLNADTTGVTAPIQMARTGLEAISTTAVNTQFNLGAVSHSLHAIKTAAFGLQAASQQFGVLGRSAQFAASGVGYVSSTISVVGGLAFNASVGLGLMLKPLYGLVVGSKLVASAFGLMFKAIIFPFKIALSVMTLFAKGLWTLAKPVFALAKLFFMVKVAMISLSTQFKILGTLMGLLPPQMRLAVGGLVALGVAGRAGSTAMGLMSAAMRVATIATLAFTQPVAAVKFVLMTAVMAVVKLTVAVYGLARAIVRTTFVTAIAGIKALGVAAASVATTIATTLVSTLVGLGKMLGFIGIIAAGWGVKLAADAEQAQIGFQTMLKSADAARAVLGELEQFAASTPFQLNDLRDGSKQLLNAQVPTEQLTAKLRMLGDIAAGTGKPINDFVRIYAKVKSTGKTSLETLNQLAERGVPIYTALQKELGVSRTEMLKMISAGEVGFTALNAALESTATGTGVFAGGMKAQSETISGLWSTLKDNVGFAVRELGIQVANAFDFKAMLAGGITFFQGIKARIATLAPVFTAVANTMRATFAALWEVASVTFTAIGAAFGVTGGNLMTTMMEALAIAKWVFQSWPDIAQLAFTKMALFAVQGFGHITHFFTGVLPSLFSWFLDNWKEVFMTAASFVGSVFQNIGRNIVAVMRSIWDFIASGGKAPLEIAWKPLTEGFKNTIKELPDIPQRAISDLEKQLSADAQRIGMNVAGDLQKEIEANMAILDASRKPVEADSFQAGQLPDPTVEQEETSSSQDEEKRIGVLERGSSEAFKAIFAGQDRAQLNETKTTNKKLDKVKDAIGKLPNAIAGAMAGTMNYQMRGPV
ncbi:hypothetical protein KOR42_06140 [Thalassoglobus neptunius]|uniref:Tape measure protein N-terminal domain-containing protein n=1 Tax=Thalassoglobus neptunius TaxID=1938619 RepID=A0A5C5X2T2_9PLAN|nr:tape measure protein [Thalassoglobus neptunius]TWT57256.1 hypothetical protein KOR42_06140 [Thalassoglobus neptunius]